VLDESIQLYRRHWATYALVSAIWLLPPGLVLVFVAASGALNPNSIVTTLQGGRLPNTTDLIRFSGALFGTQLVWALFLLAWSAATVTMTDTYLHADDVRLSAVLGRTLRRYLAILAGSFLFALGIFILTVVSFALFVFPPSALVGTLVGLIGVLVWWLRPTARHAWLKWLVIFAAPFGLPTYFAGAWSMYLAAVVVEAHGPIGGLRRSVQLLDQQWFRVVGILSLGALIVSVLQYAPTGLVQIPLGVNAATRGQVGLGPVEQAISSAASVGVQILFASLASIIYTLVFVDLRNRREGTDISERLSQLEITEPTPIATPTPNG
jgi:hypothetical protein